VTVWPSTEGLGLTEGGIKVFDDCLERAASSNKWIGNFLRMVASFEEILKEKKTPLSP